MSRLLSMPRVLLLLFLVAAPATAQGIRQTDIRMTATETADALIGQVIEFFDGSKARYREDGRYSYTYTDNSPPNLGMYTAGDGGEVCVTFDNGSARCDTYVLAGDRLVLVIRDGTRFPVRSVTPL